MIYSEDGSILAGRVPPQAVEIERAILGACLISKEAIHKTEEIIQPQDLYKDAHRKILAAIFDLAECDEVADQITVVAELMKRKQLDDIGGPLYIAELASEVATAANVAYHSRIVKDKAFRRKQIIVGTQIAAAGYDDSLDTEELKETVEQHLLTLGSDDSNDEFQNTKTMIGDAIDRIEALQMSEGMTGVPSGYKDIDEMTFGFQPSDLILIAGRPSMGKTALGLNIVRNAAVMADVSSAIFSLEMSTEQLGQRLLASEARIPTTTIRSGHLRDNDWSKLSSMAGKLTNLVPIYVNDMGGISISDLRSSARRIRKKHNIGMIVIDYLQLITTKKDYQNRTQEVTFISGQLKAMAKELDVPVIALSQLSRAVETRGGDKRPGLSDLRESGALEQDSDVVMFIYRPESYGIMEYSSGESLEGVAEIIIAKQRNGPTGTVNLTWLPEYTRFENSTYNGFDVSY